jgi:hypothetical protein
MAKRTFPADSMMAIWRTIGLAAFSDNRMASMALIMTQYGTFDATTHMTLFCARMPAIESFGTWLRASTIRAMLDNFISRSKNRFSTVRLANHWEASIDTATRIKVL